MLENYREFTFFKDFSLEELTLLEPLFRSCKYKANETIFEQGAAASIFYLLLNGSVAIRYKPYDGPEITVTHVNEGGVFGWSALVGSESYSSGAVAEGDCETICIRGEDMREIYEICRSSYK